MQAFMIAGGGTAGKGDFVCGWEGDICRFNRAFPVQNGGNSAIINPAIMAAQVGAGAGAVAPRSHKP